MFFEEYQKLARRTQQTNLPEEKRLLHALCGLTAECRELQGVCIEEKIKKTEQPKERLLEAGDILWMLSELCDVKGWNLDKMASHGNVNALKALVYDTKCAAGTALDGAAAICGIFQKELQGHPVNVEDVKQHIRFILIGIVAVNWQKGEQDVPASATLSRIMEANIEKLKRRYPEGFSEERSVNRTE